MTDFKAQAGAGRVALWGSEHDELTTMLKAAAVELQLDLRQVASSAELIAQGADYFLVTEPSTPKLTGTFTAGLLSDPGSVLEDEYRLRCLCSWDLVLTTSAAASAVATAILEPYGRAGSVLRLGAPDGEANARAFMVEAHTSITRHLSAGARERPPASAPAISYIVRLGSRPLSFVRRAVSSLAAQTYPTLHLIFVPHAPVEGLETFAAELRASGRFADVKVVEPAGARRSNTLWAGLRAVETPLFAALDDDDELLADHAAGLWSFLERRPDVGFAYSGTLRQEEDGAFIQPTGGGEGPDRFVGETRELLLLDDFRLPDLLSVENNRITMHSWLARREVLTSGILQDDPDFDVIEDVYLYARIAARHAVAMNGRATAVWNWRSRASGNSMTDVGHDHWRRHAQLFMLRLRGQSFPSSDTPYSRYRFAAPWVRSLLDRNTRFALQPDGAVKDAREVARRYVLGGAVVRDGALRLDGGLRLAVAWGDSGEDLAFEAAIVTDGRPPRMRAYVDGNPAEASSSSDRLRVLLQRQEAQRSISMLRLVLEMEEGSPAPILRGCRLLTFS